jgi:hypothetical protein
MKPDISTDPAIIKKISATKNTFCAQKFNNLEEMG